MRAVVQRVRSAAVEICGAAVGKIGIGYLVLLGIEENDTEKDLDYICEKLLGLRVFEDEAGKMNRSILDAGGSILLVSQYETLIARLREALPVETGEFGADMQVSLINDGPVTILLDSERTF